MIINILFLITSTINVMANSVLMGDLDKNGKVDAYDYKILQNVIYDAGIVDHDVLAQMDINQDGKINIDDLVDMGSKLGNKEKFTKVETKDSYPIIIPRYADTVWWKKDEFKTEAALKIRLDEAMLKIDNLVYTPGFVLQLVNLQRDLNSFLYYNNQCDENRMRLISAFDEYSKKITTDLQHRFDLPRYTKEINEYDLEAKFKWMQTVPPERKYIKKCASQLTPGKKYVVKRSTSDLCHINAKTDITYGTEIDFTIESFFGEKIKVNLPVNFAFVPQFKPKDKTDFYQWWDSCLDYTKNYWLRYGVILKVDLNETSYAQPHLINIHSSNGRSDASNYFFRGPHKRQQFEDCPTLVHELGHLMGLSDSYVEKGMICPDRPKNPELNDIMNDTGFDKYKIKHTSKQIETIFQSACGPYN